MGGERDDYYFLIHYGREGGRVGLINLILTKIK